jgi:hypothetical protein
MPLRQEDRKEHKGKDTKAGLWLNKELTTGLHQVYIKSASRVLREYLEG